MVVFIAFKLGCVVRLLRGRYEMSEVKRMRSESERWDNPDLAVNDCLECGRYAPTKKMLCARCEKKFLRDEKRAKTRNCRKIMERFAK